MLTRTESRKACLGSKPHQEARQIVQVWNIISKQEWQAHDASVFRDCQRKIVREHLPPVHQDFRNPLYSLSSLDHGGKNIKIRETDVDNLRLAQATALCGIFRRNCYFYHLS
jgi:hypothetical protein